jgi:hypothetical protein
MESIQSIFGKLSDPFVNRKRSDTCFVGTSPFLLETSKIDGVDNAAYLLASKRFIPNLSFDETREMVSRLGFFMGLDFSPQAVAQLHGSYGGHPFFTRQVCSKVHQLTGLQRPIEVPLSRVSEAQVQFASQLDTYMSDIIGNLKQSYPEEFRLLSLLVDGNRHELVKYMDEAPELVDHLMGYGLIVVRDGVHEIAIGAVGNAVRKLRNGPRQTSKQGRWSEVSLRRNELEQGIRAALYIWSKGVSNDEWKDVLRSALTESRYASLPTYEPHVLLSRSGSPMYFSDLLALLRDVRVLPYLEDHRRSAISGHMNLVNRLRRDAHANEFSDDEFEKVIQSLTELELEFLAP